MFLRPILLPCWSNIEILIYNSGEYMIGRRFLEGKPFKHNSGKMHFDFTKLFGSPATI